MTLWLRMLCPQVVLPDVAGQVSTAETPMASAGSQARLHPGSVSFLVLKKGAINIYQPLIIASEVSHSLSVHFGFLDLIWVYNHTKVSCQRLQMDLVLDSHLSFTSPTQTRHRAYLSWDVQNSMIS